MDGLLLTIGGITLVKCRPNFETPAAIHTITISSFSAMIMSTNGSTVKKNSAGRYCSPRAARKMVLSRSPIKHQQHHRGDQQCGVHQAGCVVRQCRRQRIAAHTRQHQRHDHADDQGQVERDVEPGPPVTGGERNPPPRTQPDRAGPRPIQDASHHRLGLAGQRPPRPGDPDGFQQHRPQDRLLVDDRLVPPLRDMPERRQVGGHRGHHDAAQRIEEDELDDVDGVNHPRHAVAVVDPVQRRGSSRVPGTVAAERFRVQPAGSSVV